MTGAIQEFNILDAMRHEHLWRSWFRDERGWRALRIFLAALFGLPINQFDTSLVELCTGRTVLPAGGFTSAG